MFIVHTIPNFVEQYYKHCKCVLNGKSAKAEEIFKAKTSWEAMRIGKQVKVSEQSSLTESRKILEKGILAKASKCEELMHFLKAKRTIFLLRPLITNCMAQVYHWVTRKTKTQLSGEAKI